MINKHTFPHSPLKIFSFLLIALLFGAASYLLINLAKGYQFELKGLKLSFKKTGIIIVSSRPSGAEVTLDGKIVKNSSGSLLFPSKIKGLLEGIYKLRLEKDGYIPWEKDMKVDQELVSWADYILLFPKEAKKELLIEDGKILDAKESPDLRRIAYIYENITGEQELWYFDALNLNKTKLYSAIDEKETVAGHSIENLEWSLDSSRILFTKKSAESSNLVVLNVRDVDNPVDITKTFNMNFENLIWSPTDPSELFWINDQNLHKINIANETLSASLVDKVVSANSTDDRNIYLVRDQKGERSLWKMDTNGNNLEKIVKSLPISENYKVKYSSANGNLLIIVNGKVRTIYFTENKGGKLELTELSKDATEAFWSPDGERIMYLSEKNVWTFDTEKEKEHQVLKDTDIRHALWYMDDYHLAVNDSGQYKIIEYDEGNPINIGTSKLDSVFFSLEYKYFFYLGDLEGKEDNIVIYNIRL